MAPRNQVTIRQVASEAGVSVQTVSRVINNRLDVAPETRRRVQEVIDRLSYRPNALARSLIHQRSQTLGVVTSSPEHYGPSRTLVGIERQSRALGYELLLDLLHHPETENVERILNRLLSRQVDGIIWAVSEIGNNHLWLENNTPCLSVPIIFLTMQARNHLTVASINNRKGGYLAAGHLLQQGYQHIGIIQGPWDWWEVRQRRLGWQEALAEVGQAAHKDAVAFGDWSAASGEAAFLQLLENYPQMDSVFASNDQMALGVLQAAHRLRRRVPQDLGLVGFDNIAESEYFWPPLTTVSQPLIELGCSAVEELHLMIEAGQPETGELPTKFISLDPELIVRGSSGFDRDLE